jgi:hypothetical protein
MASITRIKDELVQMIQNLPNEVPLVENRPAILRVYIDPEAGMDREFDAKLEVKDSNGNVRKTMHNKVRLYGSDHPSMEVQRENITSSLNFNIPGELLVGNLNRVSEKPKIKFRYALSFDGVTTPIEEWDREYDISNAGNDTSINVRLVGIRYRVDNSKINIRRSELELKNRAAIEYYQPDLSSIKEYQSILYRSLPVTVVNFSQATIDAPTSFGPPFPGFPHNREESHASRIIQYRQLNNLHAFLKAVRTFEIEGNAAPENDDLLKTYYNGLLAGPTENLRGEASALPRPGSNGQITENVTVGLADSTGEYSLHEMCHLLGGLHPGNPGFDQQDKEREEIDKEYDGSSPAEKEKFRRDYQKILHAKRFDIYTNQEAEGDQYYVTGSLCDRQMTRPANNSTPDFNYDKDSYIGLDGGDLTHPVELKSYLNHFDIMSYRNNVWVSNYSFRKFQQKLSAEFQLDKKIDGEPAYRIIGRYLDESANGTDNDLLQVIPVEYVSDTAIQVLDNSPLKQNPSYLVLTVKLENHPGTYTVNVEKRLNPRSIADPNKQDSYARWGVFQVDLQIPVDEKIESISYNEQEYPDTSETETELQAAADDVDISRGVFENDEGFNIRIDKLPTAYRYCILAKNGAGNNPWQTIAVESIEDNDNRKKETFDVYIDKKAFLNKKDQQTLQFKIILISGFQKVISEREITYRKLF